MLPFPDLADFAKAVELKSGYSLHDCLTSVGKTDEMLCATQHLNALILRARAKDSGSSPTTGTPAGIHATASPIQPKEASVEKGPTGLTYFYIYESRHYGWLACLSDEKAELGRAADPEGEFSCVPCAAKAAWPQLDVLRVAEDSLGGAWRAGLLDWYGQNLKIAHLKVEVADTELRITGLP